MRRTIRYKRLRRPGIRGRRPIKTEIQKTTLKIMEQEKRQVVEITAEELEELQALRAMKERKVAQQKAKADREAYKALGEDLVSKHIPKLMELSQQMAKVKTEVYKDFDALIQTKGDLFGVKQGQRSHSWRNADSTMRTTLGYHARDAWNETVEDGIAMVKQYISSLASTDETKVLVEIILDLLAKDSQGNLQAEKVLQLDKYATESGDEGFIGGVQIIKEAYIPERTKQFIRAEVKNAQNKWVIIPLGVTEVDTKKEEKLNEQEDK